MNFIGKIFVTIIFILSVVFSAGTVMVYVTHKQWKKEALRLAAELSAAKVANENMVRGRNELENEMAKERAAFRYQIAELTTKLESEKSERSKLNAQNTLLTSQVGEATAQAKLLAEQNKDLADDNTRLRALNVAAEEGRDSRTLDLVTTNDTLQKERFSNSLLDARTKELASMIASQNLVLKSHGLDIFSISDEPPPLDGVITKVSATAPLVQISLGSDDGLKTGHTLEVFRGGSYLGRIVIREIGPSVAVGQIVKELQKDNFQRGDRVATKL